MRFREVDVRLMCDLYAAGERDRQVLLALTAETRNGRRKSWWHDYTETELPSWFGLYVSLEDAAEVICQYEPELLPGLLQTRAYAEAIFRTLEGLVDEQEIQHRTKVRMERRSLLTRPRAPRLEVVISESALHRIAGAVDLAVEQLQHLLDITQRANVSVRIVPWAVGVHGGMASSGGFSLLRFPRDPITGEVLEPPLAYLDSSTGAMYLTKPDEVRVYDVIWEDLCRRALSLEDSRRTIENLLKGMAQ